MEQINICYLINKLYLDLTLKSIGYIKDRFKSKKHKLQFYIVGLDEFETPDDIIYIKSPYSDMPILWQRVYIPELIGQDKLIFIDSDTIAFTCISKLWDIPLDDKPIAVAQHCECKTFGQLLNNWRALKFDPFTTVDPDKPYFNCGVMMFDCNKWVNENYDTKCLDMIKTYKHTRYRGYDEPGFNYVLLDKWKPLDIKWNYLPQPHSGYTRCKILHYYGEYPQGTPRHNMF